MDNNEIFITERQFQEDDDVSFFELFIACFIQINEVRHQILLFNIRDLEIQHGQLANFFFSIQSNERPMIDIMNKQTGGELPELVRGPLHVHLQLRWYDLSDRK